MTFLLDPSLIIGYPSHSLTHSVTHCCLEDLIDVTLDVTREGLMEYLC